MVVELCKACGSPKPSVAAVQGDDFCSTRCARIYYGTLTARPARGATGPRPASLRRPSRRLPPASLNGRKTVTARRGV